MEETYGSRAKEVLYASKNAGKISGIDAIADSVDRLAKRFDALCARADDRRVIGGVNSGTLASWANDAAPKEGDYVVLETSEGPAR